MTSKSEEDCFENYISSKTATTLQEVPVGNCLLKTDDSLVRGAQGPLSMRADGIHSPSDSSVETLIECKLTPKFAGIGQLLIYSYFRKRDRDVVWEWYTDRGTDWETESEISSFESHVFQHRSEGSARTYRPKPRLKRINKQLVVCDLDPATAPLLAGCSELGISVDYPESGRWRTLQEDQFTPSTPRGVSSCESWVASKSREELQSEDEESLAQEFCTTLSNTSSFREIQAYREIPIGSRLSPTSGTGQRADLLIKADDNWFVVEIKRTQAKQSTSSFLKGIGQASVYATLFAAEWDLQAERVIPVVVQSPLAILGGLLRRDRYNQDFQEMSRCAATDMGQPMIVGPPATFGSD